MDVLRKYSQLSCELYFHYAMLTINSFGLQNALQRSPVDIGHFFTRCHLSAVKCVTIIRDEFGPLGYLKYAPDSLFVQGSYAVLSLLKVVYDAASSLLWGLTLSVPTAPTSRVQGVPRSRAEDDSPRQGCCRCLRKRCCQPSTHAGPVQRFPARTYIGTNGS